MSLPSADDLFRPTGEELADEASPVVRAVPDPAAGGDTDGVGSAATDATGQGADTGGRRKPSGRVRHDEKMTVYVTSDELLEIEHARLALRRSHGLAVDRGRLVREAVALALAEFEAHGEDSALVRRLGEA